MTIEPTRTIRLWCNAIGLAGWCTSMSGPRKPVRVCASHKCCRTPVVRCASVLRNDCVTSQHGNSSRKATYSRTVPIRMDGGFW